MDSQGKQGKNSARKLQAEWEDAIERAAEEKPRQELALEIERASAGIRVKSGVQGGCSTKSIQY